MKEAKEGELYVQYSFSHWVLRRLHIRSKKDIWKTTEVAIPEIGTERVSLRTKFQGGVTSGVAKKPGGGRHCHNTFETESQPGNDIGETEDYLVAYTFGPQFWLPQKTFWHKLIARKRLRPG